MKGFTNILKWLNTWKWSLFAWIGVAACSIFWLRLPPQGLQATYYYTPHFQGTPVISKIERQPDLTSLLHGRAFSPGEMFLRKTNISILWEGWLRVERGGEHGFSVETDGIASLAIDGAIIIRNGRHPETIAQKKDGTIMLTPGLHHLAIRYVQYGDTLQKLGRWKQQTQASEEEYAKKIYTSYQLSVRWSPPNMPEMLIPPDYLSPKKLSSDIVFLAQHRAVCAIIYLCSWGILALTILRKSRKAYFKAQLQGNLNIRIYKALLFLVWCIPAGVIFLGWKGIAFVAFLYFSGRPFSVLLKKQCFWLERIVFSIAISVVLFAMALSWCLHVAPFYSAVLAAACLYAFSSLMVSFWNWKQQKTNTDHIGSKAIYGILLVFNIFLCLVSVNIQTSWEQGIYADTLIRIMNHDYSFWGYKYSSILYDALIFSYLPTSDPVHAIPVPDPMVDIPGTVDIICPCAISPYYARAVTMLAVQLYLMTAISMMSLFVPQTIAVILSAFTYYFFSASAGRYTFFMLHEPLAQFSNNYALVQYPNLFFALFLPLYGMWRRSLPAIVIGFLCLAFLPASHPAYFILVVGAVTLFPAAFYLHRRYCLHEQYLSDAWKRCYRQYGLCGLAAAGMILIHGSFLREFILMTLHISRNSSIHLEMFFMPPQFWVTLWHFPTVYPIPSHPRPLWDWSNLVAFPPWMFWAIALLPYLYKHHKVFGYIISSLYTLCFFYVLRGLPIHYNGSLVDVYQPFDVLFHVVLLIASYSLLTFVFYHKPSRMIYKIAVGVLLLLTYLITGINTFFATTYPGIVTNKSGPYVVSLFKEDIPGTVRKSLHLYAEAFRLLRPDSASLH